MEEKIITYMFTEHYDQNKPYNGYDNQTWDLRCDSNYTMHDELTDNLIKYETDDNIEFFVLDDYGNRTGEAYLIVGTTKL